MRVIFVDSCQNLYDLYLYVQNILDIIRIRANKNKKHLLDQLDPTNFHCEATKHAPAVAAFVD